MTTTRPTRRRRGESPNRLATSDGIDLDREHARAARRIGAAPERVAPAAQVENERVTERAGERLQPVDELDPALDRIWVQPRGGLTGLRAHASLLARVASDHLPVRATIAWAAA